MSYKAVVCKITNLRKHSNADRLQVTTINGCNLIVGLDYNLDDVGVFFPCDGALSHEVCSYHNLYRHSELNVDKTKTGYFNDNRAIHAIKLRGEKSEGLFVKLDFLSPFLDISSLSVGDFIEDPKICTKHYTQAERRVLAYGNNKKKGKKVRPLEEVYPDFKKHFDTDQLKHYYKTIEPTSIIYITEKLHGTSQRTGFLKEHCKQGFFSKLLSYFSFKKYDNWSYISGTRNTILKGNDSGYYSGTTFRTQIHDRFKSAGIRRGETFYYEVVGWDDNGKSIMPQVSIDKIKDKEIKKEVSNLYGDKINFSYGCDPYSKLFDFYVYRVTLTNEDGYVYELPWEQVVARCNDLGFKTVPVLETMIFDGEYEKFLNQMTELTEKASVFEGLNGKKHLREGVVVRVEKGGRTSVYKHKGFLFQVLEGILKQDENFIDTEVVS